MSEPYGHFTVGGDAYVVTRYDTPRPWMNYLTNERYGLCVSQLGYGYSFYLAEMALRVTYIGIDGYVPTHPQTGRFVYLRDQESGDWWTLAPLTNLDADAYDDFRCTHELGVTTIEARRNGIEGSLRLFVVQTDNDPVEVWTVTLRNVGRRKRVIKVFPYLEWYLTSHPFTYTDVFAFNKARFDEGANAVIANMTNPESCVIYSGFMTADRTAEGWDCSQEAFLGRAGTIVAPAAVREGACRDSSAVAERMVGVLSHTVTLKRGESAVLNLLVGVGATPKEVNAFRAKFLAPAKINAELRRIRAWHRGLIRTGRTETPSELFDREATVWLKYQLLHTAKWTRGLDRGYRDILQDITGCASFWPAYTRQRLLQTLAFQYRDGTAPRQWSEIGGPHDLRRHRDSPMWIAWCLEQYLVHTGDYALLDERVPFFDGGEGTVWEHLLAGMRILYEERGAHGMCLIGDGDWNDALSRIGKGGKGESVWLTEAAVWAMRKTAELGRHIGKSEIVEEMNAKADELARLINREAWHGGYYTYAFNDAGQRVGAPENPQGNIHLNAQTWAIFADIASPEQKAALWQIIDGPLDTEIGPVLIHPAYTRYDSGIGRISGMHPGMFENGAVYSHGVAMKIMADCHEGRGSKAVETFLKVMPGSPANPPDRALVEPFASTNFFLGPACPERFGASIYSWHSGSTAWFYILAHQYILGVRPEHAGLRIDPCVPAEWSGFRAVVNLRGSTYDVRIRNRRGVERGVASVEVDGRPVEGTLVPYQADGGRHRVDVVME